MLASLSACSRYCNPRRPGPRFVDCATLALPMAFSARPGRISDIQPGDYLVLSFDINGISTDDAPGKQAIRRPWK